MKKVSVFAMILLLLLLSACHSRVPAGAASPATTTPETEALPPETETATIPTESAPPAPPVPAIVLTDDEKTMLLKLGMAERGSCECTECIALVMKTVLNRVEAGRFGSSIRSVIFAQDQFTPVSDGSYDAAEPNERCLEALDWILYGWDESQGALYYEWCTGESWHSKNLHLLFQHCDVRFYD